MWWVIFCFFFICVCIDDEVEEVEEVGVVYMLDLVIIGKYFFIVMVGDYD